MSDDQVENDSKAVNVRSTGDRENIKSAEVSVGEIFSPKEDDDDEHRSSIDTNVKTKNSSGATQDSTSLGQISHEKTIKHLNPNAPDFKPIEFSSSYRSELAPGHASQRRSTHTESYDHQNSRSRCYSETQPNADSSTSIIRPLLSIVPQYIPHHRKSWASTTPLSISSSSSWWPEEYSNPSSAASSYHTRPAYQIYTPLMEQQSLTDENGYSNNQQQQQQKYPPKRPRSNTGRPFIHPNKRDALRQRSHSGPEAPSTPSSTHLTGIHSLARIMVDLLRMIKSIPEESKESKENIVSNNLSETSSIPNQHSSGNQLTASERERENTRNSCISIIDINLSNSKYFHTN